MCRANESRYGSLRSCPQAWSSIDSKASSHKFFRALERLFSRHCFFLFKINSVWTRSLPFLADGRSVRGEEMRRLRASKRFTSRSVSLCHEQRNIYHNLKETKVDKSFLVSPSKEVSRAKKPFEILIVFSPLCSLSLSPPPPPPIFHNSSFVQTKVH